MLDSKILDAAIDQFGRYGFDGASTRQIAKMSGTAMSSITYHFGGKHGLYLAAADHIVEGVRELQQSAIQSVVSAATNLDATSRPAAIEQMLGMLDSFAVMMLAPQSEHWARFIVREQQAPTEAFERIYQGIMRPMSEACVTLVKIARPDLDEPSARALTVMLFGEALVLRVGRASVCRILRVDALGDAEMALLRHSLRETASCILHGGSI